MKTYVLTIEYNEELKLEVSNLLKILSEYGEDRRSITQ